MCLDRNLSLLSTFTPAVSQIVEDKINLTFTRAVCLQVVENKIRLQIVQDKINTLTFRPAVCLKIVKDTKKNLVTFTFAVCLQKIQDKINILRFTPTVCLQTLEAKKKNLQTFASPSLISLVVSVDVKHQVYLFYIYICCVSSESAG